MTVMVTNNINIDMSALTAIYMRITTEKRNTGPQLYTRMGTDNDIAMGVKRQHVIEIHAYSMKGEQLLLYGPNRAILWQPLNAIVSFMTTESPKCVLRVDMANRSFVHHTDYIHSTFIMRRFIAYAKSIPSILNSSLASEERKRVAYQDRPREATRYSGQRARYSFQPVHGVAYVWKRITSHWYAVA